MRGGYPPPVKVTRDLSIVSPVPPKASFGKAWQISAGFGLANLRFFHRSRYQESVAKRGSFPVLVEREQEDSLALGAARNEVSTRCVCTLPPPSTLVSTIQNVAAKSEFLPFEGKDCIRIQRLCNQSL